MLLTEDAQKSFLVGIREQAFEAALYSLRGGHKSDILRYRESARMYLCVLEGLLQWAFTASLMETRQLRRQARKHGFPQSLIPKGIRRGVFYDVYKNRSKEQESSHE